MEHIPSYTDSLYLEHHGIKGQHWGVRRFQNEDGSRTSAGRRREKKWADTFNKAAEKADRLSKYAKKDTKDYTNKRNKFIDQSVIEGTSKKQANYFMDNNVRISKRQAARYKNLANKYRNVDYDSISKKDYKEAKNFLKNAFHTNANLAWVTDTYNYEDHD